jgi:hypothetical protein
MIEQFLARLVFEISHLLAEPSGRYRQAPGRFTEAERLSYRDEIAHLSYSTVLFSFATC